MMKKLSHDSVRRGFIPGFAIVQIDVQKLPNCEFSRTAILRGNCIMKNHITVLFPEGEVSGVEDRLALINYSNCRFKFRAVFRTCSRCVDSLDAQRLNVAIIALKYPSLEFVKRRLYLSQILKRFFERQTKPFDHGPIAGPICRWAHSISARNAAPEDLQVRHTKRWPRFFLSHCCR